MALTFFCANLKCKAVLEVDEGQRGRKVRCKKCGQMIMVPRKSSKDN